ncbi:hypothetical protein BKP45_13380 [Anaerobacillus alkalidiazotrophicus]|uniref:Uncharacterized protein n=1 Tax=Anaerobacillus alkalidiazotrophicus TaxID=472963 RepID=A0A1S2M3T8_9BACI|nr:hypothetical protein BKP45_13380 [Anaerobacillus alkalidiazotrophicus]
MRKKQISIILFIVLMNFLFKTWKVVPKYYKSLIFVSFWNSFYYYLCKRHLVFEYTNKGINWKLLRGLHIFIATPLLVLLFLCKLPKTLSKQIVYILKWGIGSFFIELFLLKQKLIKFKYGWNIYWSGLIYFKMYTYSYLFNKRPFLTWVLSIFSLLFYIFKFNVPLTKRLLKGPFLFFLPKSIKYPINFKTRLNSYYYETVKDLLNYVKFK